MLRGRNRILCAIAVGALVGLAVVVDVSPAFAGYAKSANKNYGPVRGYNYYNYASVTTNSRDAWAHTHVSNRVIANVPSGYMGALARLYLSNGVLCSQSSWKYNNQPLVGFSQIVSTDCGVDRYYSYGQTRAHNGNGYNTYTTNTSPYQSVGSLSLDQAIERVGTAASWPKNPAGLTYGSSLYAKSPADEPDLIAAYARNGRIGYVKRINLESPAPGTPREALAMQARSGGVDQQLPVYDLDGDTQIGVFILHG